MTTLAAAPMPPVHQDPTVLGANALRENYKQAVGQVGGDPRLSDRDRALQHEALATVANDQLGALKSDYYARRAARIQDLQSVFPIGPDVPASAAPEARMVLLEGFRQAYEDAKGTDTNGRLQMLAQAERFQDETRLRAVLTASDETNADVQEVLSATGDRTPKNVVLMAWLKNHPELGDPFDELDALNNNTSEQMMVRMATDPLPRTTSAASLATPVLVNEPSGRRSMQVPVVEVPQPMIERAASLLSV